MQPLKKVGLTDGEIKAYTFLLLNGPSTANKISKSTGLNRSNLYTILNSLANKNLISLQKSKSTTYFIPNPVDTLNRLIDQRVKELKQIKEELSSTLKSLLRHRSKIPTVNVETLSGKEHIKDILWEIIQTEKKDQILCFGYERSFEKFYPAFFKKIKSVRKKRSLPFYGILFCTKKKKHKEKKYTFVKYIFSKKSTKVRQIQIVLFNETIYLFLLSDLPIVIKIYSEQLYQFLKFLFWGIWNLL